MTDMPAIPIEEVDLSVEVCGIRFPNPVWTAAGPPVRTARHILDCAAGGAGGLVTKTISVKAADVPTPNMAEIRNGFLNTELWSELPPEQWLEHEYEIARQAEEPMIVSMGYSPADIAELAPKVRPFADAVELSTHYIGEDPAPMMDAIKVAKDALDVPVWVKMSPLGREMSQAAEHAQQAGVDAIVAINSFGPCLSIDIETGKPTMGGTDGYGWLSGPALKPLAVRCVMDVVKAVDVPVIGCGGISRGTDIVEHFMAGASAVQVCTAAILRGPQVYGKLVEELRKWMAAHGHRSLESIRGLTHTHEIARNVTGPLVIDADLCNGCTICVGSCVYDALQMVDGKAVVDNDKCEQCGLCITRCRPDAMIWAPGGEAEKDRVGAWRA
jgi:dihydroorotate dehydrogenase (NAD+) catalytic subunit